MKGNSHNFRLVIFDVDGTLLDTSEFIFQAFEHTLKTHNLPIKTREEIRPHIGTYILDIYKALAPNSNPNKLSQTHATFQLKNTQLAESFPKIRETLTKLRKRGIKIVAVSNRRITTKESLKATGILKYIDLVITPDDGTKPKPNPESIFKSAKKFSVKIDEIVMVGDSEQDILTGRNANVKTIGITHGFHGKKVERYKPDFVVNNLTEVLPIVLGTN